MHVVPRLPHPLAPNSTRLNTTGQRRVLWHNMREEPVLYINGKPYVVREADQPFCNVEYTGVCVGVGWGGLFAVVVARASRGKQVV